MSAFLKCTTAKIGFEKNKISIGFEALARAQSLLRSKKSFEELTLLSQVRLILDVCGITSLHLSYLLFVLLM